MSNVDETSIRNAVDDGAERYFKQCRNRIDIFIVRHFEYPGAWTTNRVALGWDLLRSPCNLFWAPIYLLLQLICFGLALLPWPPLQQKVRMLSKNLPSGLTTKVQQHLSHKIQEEIFADPRDDSHSLAHLVGESLRSTCRELSDQTKTIQIIKDTLSQYALTRTASADISNSLFTTILGAFWFKKFTPGGIAVGIVFATWLNHHWLVDDFFLGNYLGGIYYKIFPPSPSVPVLLASILLILCMLSIFASFSGLISDPIQSKVGLHKRRLHKMIDAIEIDFLVCEKSRFRPKDQYVARILDLLDAAKSSLL